MATKYGNKDFVKVWQDQVKKGSKWVTVSTEVEDFTEKQYRGITSDDWMHHYNNLGGSYKRYKNFTSEGYIVVKIINVSPNRKERSVVYLYPSYDWKQMQERIAKRGY